MIDSGRERRRTGNGEGRKVRGDGKKELKVRVEGARSYVLSGNG